MGKRIKKRRIKPFDELTITDDFLFGVIMKNEKYLKPLLEYILDVKTAYISYIETQKTIDLNYEAKGICLDVYCEDEKHTVYSVEIQTSDEKNLGKRIRFYADMIDLNVFDKGEDYKHLKKSVVIFICTFDYFKKDRYKYTFKRQCQEDPGVYLDDETTVIVLNVNGKLGDIDEELKGALRYMAGELPAGRYAGELDKAVKEVKGNEKWRYDYMKLALKFKEEKRISEFKIWFPL